MRITDIVYINIIKNVFHDLLVNCLKFWKEPLTDNNFGISVIHVIAFVFIQYKFITVIGWPFLINIIWPSEPEAQMACLGLYTIIYLILIMISCLEMLFISKIVKCIISYKENYIARYGNPFENKIDEDNKEHHYTWTD